MQSNVEPCKTMQQHHKSNITTMQNNIAIIQQHRNREMVVWRHVRAL